MVFHLEKNSRKTAVTAGIIGNIMEWYDFALYGYMASILAKLFFPRDNQVASLLATYRVFAAGFVMRPLGSVFFGWLGDTVSRSKAMLLSVAMMVIPTVVLGILPSYQKISKRPCRPFWWPHPMAVCFMWPLCFCRTGSRSMSTFHWTGP